jgi:predicted nucleic acid-binding protein
MGKLTLPKSGVVYLDANIVIYSVEKIAPYYTILEPMWRASQNGDFGLVSSELLLLETLVKPIKEADVTLENLFRELLLNSREFQLIPITIPILDSAAQIRATTRLKPPDAIHAATALSINNCTMFLTNDGAFQRVSELSVTVLDHVISQAG